MSFHSQLCPKDPHVLCSYVAERSFQVIWVQLAHQEPSTSWEQWMQEESTAQSHSPAHCMKGQGRRAQTAAPLLIPNSSLLPATQKYLHEDDLCSVE